MARILVIDDDYQIRDMLSQILEQAGYDVEVAPDGAVGVNMYRENPADLIITDILMPEKEGWETITELRRDFPDVRIIAISGGGEKTGPYSYLMLAKRFGAEHVFTKPVKKEELLRAIRGMLGQDQ